MYTRADTLFVRIIFRSQWNTVMSGKTHVGGEVNVDKKFDLYVKAIDSMPAQKFKPKVELYSDKRGIQWTGHAGNLDFGGMLLFYTETIYHQFTLQYLTNYNNLSCCRIGIVDGTHYLLLEKIDEGTTRLIHGERFSGILIFLLKLVVNFILLPKIRKAYVKFNLALKQEAEKRVK